MPDDQPPDLVDEYLRPFVRPLGNIVILYANAEAALRDFVMEVLLQQCAAEANKEAEARKKAESQAHRIVSDENWRSKVAELIEASGLNQRKKLRSALKEYADAREQRNRLVHDEWYLAIDEQLIEMDEEHPALDAANPEASVAAIRGRKPKRSEPVYDAPTVAKLWELARRFAGVREIFDNAAHHMQPRLQEGSSI